MAKNNARSSLLGLRGQTPATPKSNSVTGSSERLDVFEKAMSEAGKATNDPEAKSSKKSVQRNRQGMAKATVHMQPEARDELKIFGIKNGEKLEEFILNALNERLERMGADFRIG